MRAVLVLDGSRLSDEWRDTPVLTVLCSRGGEAADAVMEAWMARLGPSERLKWALVSNDVNLCRMGSGMGLRVRSCSLFVEELAAFAKALPVHSLDFLHSPKPGISRPFNNPFGRLAIAAILAAGLCSFVPQAAAAEFGGFVKPEAALCDPSTGEIYVTNSIPPRAPAPGDPSDPPTGGFISRISSNGVVLIQKFIQGGPEKSGRELRDPKGMALSGGALYVADGAAVQVYRADTGGWLRAIRVSDRADTALSAVAAGRRGELYVADAAAGRIHKIDTRRGDKATVFIQVEALQGMSGMVLDPVTGHLFVVTRNSGQLVRIDRGKKPQVVKKGLGPLDGLALDPEGVLYFSSSERGEVYRVPDRGRGPISLVAGGLRSPSGIDYDAIRHAVLVILKADGRLTSIPLSRPDEGRGFRSFVKHMR